MSVKINLIEKSCHNATASALRAIADLIQEAPNQKIELTLDLVFVQEVKKA